jgi:hypothetical protein
MAPSTMTLFSLSGSQPNLSNEELRRFVNSHGYVVPDVTFQF